MNCKRAFAKAALIPLSFAAFAPAVSAHCPLCTAGIALAAGGAVYMGVNKAVIGIFVGAFAISTGWWVARLIKKKLFRFQDTAIIFLSFLLTVLPLYPLLDQVTGFPIYWFGDYGSIFNKTYLIHISLVTSIIGGLIILLAPWLSKRISSLRGDKVFPFQGIVLSILLLIVSAV